MPPSGGTETPPSAAERAGVHRRELPPSGGGESRCSPAGIAAVWRRRQKGTGHHMVSCPLLTPLTFLCAATPFGRAAKRGLRGLGSVRRAAFGTHYCPEFTLREPPRITVRGQTVQGGSVPLRKAPLRSRMKPWSTKRICGPFAFRRATEGSRVQRKVRGVKRGIRNHSVSYPPFAPVGGHRHPRPPKAAIVHALRGCKVASSGEPLYRRR